MRFRSIVGAVLVGFFVVALAAAQNPPSPQSPPSVEELRARVAADPDSGPDWYALGLALQRIGELEAALTAFERAGELQYQRAGVAMRSAQIVAAMGDPEEALRRLAAAAETAPVTVSLLPQIGGIPELEGDPRLQEILDDAEAARYPCRARPESRQLDFWLGEWTVSNPQGQVAGENVITMDLEGCVVRESWTDGYGGRGTSVNFWDTTTSAWHQIWTSDNGTVTHYRGEWRDGAMRFLTVGLGGGPAAHQRMTFTPNPDGSVRQLIEMSEDGSNWNVGFDGVYRKKTPSR
jgi:hypothetical protein